MAILSQWSNAVASTNPHLAMNIRISNHVFLPLLVLILSVGLCAYCAWRARPGDPTRVKQAFMVMCGFMILWGILGLVCQFNMMRGEALAHVRHAMEVYGTFAGGAGTGMALALALTGGFTTFRRTSISNTDAA